MPTIDDFFSVFQSVKRGIPIRRIEAWLFDGLANGVDEADALVLLSKHEDGYRMGQFARDLHSDPSNAARTARLLVKQGLASRVQSPEDRRGVILKITPKGRAISRVLVERRQVIAQALFAELSESQRKAIFASLGELQRVQEAVYDKIVKGEIAAGDGLRDGLPPAASTVLRG